MNTYPSVAMAYGTGGAAMTTTKFGCGFDLDWHYLPSNWDLSQNGGI